VLFAAMFRYFHLRTRAVDQVFRTLKKEWTEAESRHVGLFRNAQASLNRLGTDKPKAEIQPQTAISVDVRNQVAAMAKKGLTVLDISRSCGLPEGEVDVLLGLARLKR
jgi:hypothetical protein